MILPKISVVTLSYNQGQFLEQTIKSVLEQDYPGLEYIIMDGGSTDNSVEIIKRYEQHLTYWQSQPDGGQSAAINAGFARATGAILCWLNSDDQFTPGALKRVGEYFSEHSDCQWLAGAGDKHYLDKNVQHAGIAAGIASKNSLLYFWAYGADNTYMNQPSVFWSRKLWDMSGGYVREDKPNSMDYELWLRFDEFATLNVIPDTLSLSQLHVECKSKKYRSAQKLEAMKSAYEAAVRRNYSVVILTLRFLYGYEKRFFVHMLKCVKLFAPRGFVVCLHRILSGFFLIYSSQGRLCMLKWYERFI